jgi:hypothetical protein
MSIVKVAPDALPSKLAPFTGVNNATARLLKAISAFELSSLNEGDVVYVQSVRDYWKWLPTSVITSDDISYCAPTAVGVGAGRFERLMWSSPDWNLQTEWHISSAGNDENTGLAGAPLLTTTERRRRWGDKFQMVASTAYHIRYLSDGYSDILRATRASNAVVYCHASTVNGEGASTLFSGTINATDTLNTATGQPYTITCNALPVSWTASALIGGATRTRLTSGTLSVSMADFQDAVTPKKAWFDEFLTPVASLSVAPFVSPSNTQAAPVVNDTFVVESYRVVTRLHIDIVNASAGSSATAVAVVLDSLSVNLSGGKECGVYCYSCAPSTNFGKPAFTSFRACVFAALSLNDIGLKTVIGGSATGGVILMNQDPSTSSITNFTLPAASTSIIFSGSGNNNSPDGWRPGQIGIHNHTTVTSAGLLVAYTSAVRLGSGWIAYGLNNSAALWMTMHSSVIIAQNGTWTGTTGYQTSATNILGIWDGAGMAANVPAFDDTTGLYTGVRLLSRANLEATVAAGGFNYVVSNPRSNGAGANHF